MENLTLQLSGLEPLIVSKESNFVNMESEQMSQDRGPFFD